MSVSRLVSAAAVISVLTLGIAGCGGSSAGNNSAADDTEQTSGNQPGGSDAGDADKTGTTTAKYGSDAVLPDTWPSDLKFPDDLVIVRTSEKPGGKSTVTSTCSGPAEDMYETMTAMLKDGGYSPEQGVKGFNDTDGGMGTLIGTSGDRKVNISVFGTDGGECGNVVVTYSN